MFVLEASGKSGRGRMVVGGVVVPGPEETGGFDLRGVQETRHDRGWKTIGEMAEIWFRGAEERTRVHMRNLLAGDRVWTKRSNGQEGWRQATEGVIRGEPGALLVVSAPTKGMKPQYRVLFNFGGGTVMAISPESLALSPVDNGGRQGYPSTLDEGDEIWTLVVEPPAAETAARSGTVTDRQGSVSADAPPIDHRSTTAVPAGSIPQAPPGWESRHPSTGSPDAADPVDAAFRMSGRGNPDPDTSERLQPEIPDWLTYAPRLGRRPRNP